MSGQQTGFIKFRRVDSIRGTPDPRTLYLINKYSETEEDAVITHIDLQFGGFSVGRMDYTTELNSDNDVILKFTYNDSSRKLEVEANLKRDTSVTNLLKIGDTGWYVNTKDVESIIDSYIVTAFPTPVTDTTVPSTKLVKTELDNRVIKNDNITAGTKTKITYDAKGLVTKGEDLVAADIPNLDTAKITTGTFADARIPALAASKITSGTFTDARIPSLSPSKITQDTNNRFVSDAEKTTWNGKVDKVSGKGLSTKDFTAAHETKLNGIATGAQVNVQSDWDATTGDAFIKNKPTTFTPSSHTHTITNITGLQTALDGKEDTENKIDSVRAEGTATDENYPSELAVRAAINAAVQGLTVENHTHEITDVLGLQASLNKKEDEVNKVASWGTTPTDTKYPSEKLVKDSLDAKESAANKVTSWGTTPTDTKYPSEKLVKDSLDAKVNIEVGKGLSTKDYTEAEQTKLAGIAEGAEVNVQSDWSQTVTTADDFIKNKPTLATVATTGSFNDLIDTPEGIDPTDFEKIANRVTTVGAEDTATDENYPSELAVRVELDTKANSTHPHVITDVTNLEDALALKEDKANKVTAISAKGIATDEAYPTEKAVRKELDLREALVNKRTTIRASGTATDGAYPSEKAVRTELDTKIDKTSIYKGAGKTLPTDLPSDASSSDSSVMSQKASILSFSKRGHTHAEFDTKVNKNDDIMAGTKTKITYDVKGLVTKGEDLAETDIPELPQSKITDLGTDLGNKVTKNPSITGGTNTKITYDAKGLVTGGTSLSATDIPELPQSKIKSLTTDLGNKVTKNSNILAETKTKITYDAKGLVTGGTDLEATDIPELPQANITGLETDLGNKENTANKVTGIRASAYATHTNYPTERAVRRELDNKADKIVGVTTWTSATKTLALSDANKLFVCYRAGNQTVTIPSITSVSFPIGTMITFLLTSLYKVTFSSASGVTLTSMDDLVTLATLHGMASLIKIAPNAWQLVGALE